MSAPKSLSWNASLSMAENTNVNNTVVPSHSLAWYHLLPRMALTFVLDLVFGPPSLRGMTV